MQGEDDLRGLAVYFLAAPEVENDIRALISFRDLGDVRKRAGIWVWHLIDMQIK